MAADDARKRYIGKELVDWIYLGTRTGMRRSVEIYQTEKVSNPSFALYHLTRAVDLPRQRRARILAWMNDYDSRNGAGTAQTFLAECLSLAGTVTLGELNTDLTSLETQMQTIIDANIAGDTLDQVAAAIESGVTWEAKEWVFPIPVDFVETILVDN